MTHEPLYNIVYTSIAEDETPDTDTIAIAEAFKKTIHSILVDYDAISDKQKKQEFLKKFE
jgi:hypothetical protein